MKANDLTGKKFGRLLAIGPTTRRLRGNVVWEFRCDCGNTVFRSGAGISSGDAVSCGCMGIETRKKAGKNLNTGNSHEFVLGTSVCKIRKMTISANNTSGFRGVYRSSNLGSWRASIVFKQRTYYLGEFKNINDAAKARKEAEKNIFGSFLEWYDEYKKSIIAEKVTHLNPPEPV